MIAVQVLVLAWLVGSVLARMNRLESKIDETRSVVSKKAAYGDSLIRVWGARLDDRQSE